MTFDVLIADGYDNPSMAPGDKPYRVYRGGRSRGNVPLKQKSGASSGRRAAAGDGAGPVGLSFVKFARLLGLGSLAAVGNAE